MAKSIHDDDILGDNEAEVDGELIGAFSRKTLTVIIASLVVVAAVGVVLLLYTVDEGGVASVQLTGPSRSDDILTFAYTIRTERASATGKCDLTVLYDGATVLTRSFNAAGGGGRLDVRFAEFVVGNGEYTFRLDYRGTRGTASFTLPPGEPDSVVTALVSNAQNETWVDDGHIGAIQYSVYFYSDIAAGNQTRAPPGSYVVLQLSKNSFADGPPINISVEGKTFFTRTLNISLGPGFYAVDATFTNQWVRPDAEVKTITLRNTTFVHNKPYACVVGSPYHGNNANGFTITADASCSRDDIAIVQYTWEFGDGSPPVTNGAIPTEAHAYPPSTLSRSYTGSVSVYDGYVLEPDIAYFTVTTSSN